MTTKAQIEEAIITELDTLAGVVAKREFEQDYLTVAKNTVFIKVKSYKFSNEDENETFGIQKEQKVTIDIQVRIIYRTIQETSNISDFEGLVITKLVGLELNNPALSGLVLRPVQLNETTEINKDLRQSINFFRIITFMEFNSAI